MSGDAFGALGRERAETLARIGALKNDLGEVIEASALVATDDEHDPEGATIAYDRAQLAAVLEQAQRHLAEIDAAFERVRSGTYGVCAACGASIPAERLAA